jgi:3-oxoacyl-[acyl-carrier protein] reductase
MKLGLENKIALIAGASKGLGYATALSLAQEGANVAICARDADRVATAAKTIQQKTGVKVFAMAIDVTRAEEVTRWVNAAAEKFGAIHICVTNTGGPPSMLFTEIDDEQWQRAINLTLLSAIRLSRAVIPFMQKQQWGRIIHLCSYSVKNLVPNLILSNSIRSAVVALGKTQAEELAAQNILVNSVLPGWADTERVGELMQARAQKQSISVEQAYAARQAAVPLKRMARPEEIADAVTFLASERASFITGTTLTVDGGETRFPF